MEGKVDTLAMLTSTAATTLTGYSIHPEPMVPDPLLDSVIKGLVSVLTGLAMGLITKWLDSRKTKK